MRFKRKHNDSDELSQTARLAAPLLEKLTATLEPILPLMQRMEMGDSAAYREYEEALHTLERLQHTNETLAARAGQEMPPAPPESGKASPAPEGTALSDTALSRRVQLLFGRSASVESAEEGASVFSLFRSHRRPVPPQETSPVLRRPRAADAVRPSRLPAGAPVVPEVPPAPLPMADSAAPPVPPMYKVQFAAVAPGPLLRGGHAVLHLFMTEKDLSLAVEDLLRRDPAGPRQAQRGFAVRTELQSPDLELSRHTQTRTWSGEYLRFDFALSLPEEDLRRQVRFSAVVYINEVIATRLKFLVNCAAPDTQIVIPRRRDVLSAFLSYAGEDRARAEALLQGIQKARPDLHVFSDVDSLRSGANWREVLPLEIARRDVFFLCWSHYARDSFWVNWEWHCALKVKEADRIVPIPLERPDRCPPPKDLDGRHFNDHLLQMMDAMQNGT